ncbi:hypothetical protein THAOC_25834, partial [Thalassiosira oceanica]
EHDVGGAAQVGLEAHHRLGAGPADDPEEDPDGGHGERDGGASRMGGGGGGRPPAVSVVGVGRLGTERRREVAAEVVDDRVALGDVGLLMVHLDFGGDSPGSQQACGGHHHTAGGYLFEIPITPTDLPLRYSSGKF